MAVSGQGFHKDTIYLFTKGQGYSCKNRNREEKTNAL